MEQRDVDVTDASALLLGSPSRSRARASSLPRVLRGEQMAGYIHG